MKNYALVFLAVLLISSTAAGQNLEESVDAYSSKNGTLYLQPLADVFGANLNSGFFHTAKIPKFGLHINVGVAAMYAPIGKGQKTFKMVDEPDLNWTAPPETVLPTLFGEDESVEVAGLGDMPGGIWQNNFFPTAVPQLTIGSFMGTEATFRWIEYNVDDDIGKIKLSRWGLRHSLSHYILLCPVDIAVGYWQQKFTIGDIVEANTRFYGIQASKSISILTLYCGLGIEHATLKLEYNNQDLDKPVRFELEGNNTTRTTLGASLDLAVVKFHIDMNMANQTTYSAGLGIGF